MIQVKRALISVSDKTGLLALARGLAGLGVELISTGGTAKLLADNGLAVKPISEITHFPEMLDGRVKTLHPAVHGGLLARRDNPEHMRQIAGQGISPIDLVVVNLYPFEETVAKAGVPLEEAIENIDIGGPTMLRSAAKNHAHVAVLVDPADYSAVLDELKSHGGISHATAFNLARKVFQHTAHYDGAISSYLSRVGTDGKVGEGDFPPRLYLEWELVQGLRYGENPHQKAAFYKQQGYQGLGLPQARQLQGKELSFNNILDLDAAFGCALEFDRPVAVVIKHTNPCGVAVAESLAEAYVKARETDPVSAFGSVLGFNRVLDSETAVEIVSTFVEAVIAPGFDARALDVLKTKTNLRLLEVPEALSPGKTPASGPANWDFKRVLGGLLVQERDHLGFSREDCRVVSKRQPTAAEWEGLDFAWRVVKHVKSNAIVYANKDQTVGVGAGQMSRVDSSKIAVQKAHLPVKGTVLASDAFFPFRDGVDAAAEAGATAVIQPGGSQKDEEVIRAADEHGMAMVFTGVRHFKH